MKVEVDLEVIAKIRDALTVIQLKAEFPSGCMDSSCLSDRILAKEIIVKQVKKIDKLLPRPLY